MLKAVWALPLIAGLAACQQTPPANAPLASQPGAPPAVADAREDPEMDAFIAMVNAERWGVLIDKAMQAVHERPFDASEPDAAQLLRADRATKDGAAALLLLRNEICGDGLMSGPACNLSWPAWASETPSATTPIAVIETRSDWLGAAMEPFVQFGCELGRRTSGDRQYCDVE